MCRRWDRPPSYHGSIFLATVVCFIFRVASSSLLHIRYAGFAADFRLRREGRFCACISYLSLSGVIELGSCLPEAFGEEFLDCVYCGWKGGKDDAVGNAGCEGSMTAWSVVQWLSPAKNISITIPKKGQMFRLNSTPDIFFSLGCRIHVHVVLLWQQYKYMSLCRNRYPPS